MNKYRNIKTTIDGIEFDSKLESNRYSFLKLMEKTGGVKDLVLQPSFELQRKFTDSLGHNHRAINYVGDFGYTNSAGSKIVEDCKGMLTEVFKIKEKLFCFAYPGIKFYKVTKDNDVGGITV